MGIQLGSNFTVNTALPLDDRNAVATLADRDAIEAGRLYEGLQCFVEEDGKNYQYIGGAWAELAAGSDIGESTDYARAGFSARFNEAFESTDLADTLDKILKLQYTAPTISLASSPSNSLREKGTVVSSITLNATVTKRSDPIATVRFYRAGTLIHTEASPTPNGGVVSHTHNTAFSDTITFTAQVVDNGATGGPSTITSSNLTHTFVYPYYYGVGSAGLTGAQIASLTKDVRSSSASVAVTTSPTGQHFYFAYPAAYPALTSILDANGFETISGYTVRTVNITGLDGTSQSYRVYESTLPTTQVNFTNTYKR